MKKISWLLAGMLMGLPLLAQAEPISFEQAGNVTGAIAGIETGIDFDYSYTKLQQEGVPTQETTLTNFPVFVRVGFPALEFKISAPYGTVKSNSSAIQENSDFSGLRNVDLMLKTALLPLPVFKLALGVDTNFPTGDPKYYFGKGLELTPFLAADLNFDVIIFHGNVGYQYRGDYTIDSVTLDSNGNVQVQSGVKIKPGNATYWAVGAELPAGDVFSLLAELTGTTYGEVQYAGSALPDSSGTTMSLVPGIRVHAGPFKAKLGYQIPLENKDKRPAYAPVADWRVLAGVSLMFGM